MSNRVLLAGERLDGKMVSFEIISTRIIEKEGVENRYVSYTIKVTHFSSGKEDENPIQIERRYTHFSNLYNALRDQFPDLMNSITFPKKVLMGNFDDKLITERSTSFENLLKHITSESRLTYTPAFVTFLQDPELQQAKSLMESKRYDLAIPLLESNFTILSKVYTDRTKAVILALCRLLGCCATVPGSPNADKWANLALHRYEGVSDSDLLSLYVPILQLCLKIQGDSKKEQLTTRLDELKRLGVRIDDTTTLLEAVTKLESCLNF